MLTSSSYFPDIVEYQPHSLCNANCNYCPIGGMVRANKVPPIEMSEATFNNLLSAFDGKKLLKVSPHLNTEPLLSRSLESQLRSWRSSHPEAVIEFSTNCVLLSGDRFRSLIDSGISSLTLHFMGVSKSIHESSMKTRYEVVKKNIETVASINSQLPNPIDLTICGHRVNGASLSEWRKFTHYWTNLGVNVDLGPLWNRAGWYSDAEFSKSKKGFLKSSKPSPCKKPFNQIAIEYTGNVVLCSLDYQHKVDIGNINDSSVLDIWNSPVMNTYRQGQENALKHNLDLCKDCIRGGRYILDSRRLTRAVNKPHSPNPVSESIYNRYLSLLDLL